MTQKRESCCLNLLRDICDGLFSGFDNQFMDKTHLPSHRFNQNLGYQVQQAHAPIDLIHANPQFFVGDYHVVKIIKIGRNRDQVKMVACIQDANHVQVGLNLPGFKNQAKSGITGGIVTVSPGKGGMGSFAPPLDSAGNSVKGHLVAKFLSQQLAMALFLS